MKATHKHQPLSLQLQVIICSLVISYPVSGSVRQLCGDVMPMWQGKIWLSKPWWHHPFCEKTISLTAFHAILTTQYHQINNYKHQLKIGYRIKWPCNMWQKRIALRISSRLPYFCTTIFRTLAQWFLLSPLCTATEKHIGNRSPYILLKDVPVIWEFSVLDQKGKPACSGPQCRNEQRLGLSWGVAQPSGVRLTCPVCVT